MTDPTDDRVAMMELGIMIEREEGLIKAYEAGAETYRHRVYGHYRKLGRIEQRLQQEGP